jgi:hypothetical protein
MARSNRAGKFLLVGYRGYWNFFQGKYRVASSGGWLGGGFQLDWRLSFDWMLFKYIT